MAFPDAPFTIPPRRLTGRRVGALLGPVALLAMLLVTACGEPAPAIPDSTGANGSATQFVDDVSQILSDETRAFAAFFGTELLELGTAEGMARERAQQAITRFQTQLAEAQQRARALEPPPTATLFFGSFLEHFDRFVGDAETMLASITQRDYARAAETYTRLKRGASERLDFLRDRLNLIESS